MEITAIEYYSDKGRPSVRMSLDIGDVDVTAEEQRMIARGLPYANLGAEYEDVIEVKVPKNEHQPAHTLPGHTDDHKVVAVMRKLIRDSRAGTFKPGPQPIPSE